MGKKDKFDIQDEKYEIPYHYLPYLSEDRGLYRFRSLGWGHVYLCYLFHIKKIIHSKNPNSIIDIGCGEGRFLGLLDQNKFDKIVGVDLSEKAIRFARAFHPKIDFKNCDARELSTNFKIVTAIEVLKHIPDEETDDFLKTLENKTQKGGNVIISVPTKVVPKKCKAL